MRGPLEQAMRHHSRSAETCRLQFLHGRQMASRARWSIRSFAASMNFTECSEWFQFVLAGKSVLHAFAERSYKACNYATNKFYSTDVFGDYALDFIDARQRREQSHGSCISHSTPRIFRCTLTKNDIAKYEPIYQQGWDKIREQRLARQKELGIRTQRFETARRAATFPKIYSTAKPAGRTKIIRRGIRCRRIGERIWRGAWRFTQR